MATKVGIIGCGAISQFHLNGYQKAGAEVIAVCDADEALAKKTADSCGAKYFSDYRHLLHQKEIEAVSVCVPNYLHYRVALDALEAGKHVLCEKPMTTTLADAENLVNKVQETGLVFQVGYMKRFKPGFILMKKLLPQIGRMETGHFRVFHYFPLSFWEKNQRSNVAGRGSSAPNSRNRPWQVQAVKTGGCALPHSGSHLLDTMLWLFDDPVSVDARVMKKNGYDVDYLCTAFFELQDGATIFFEVSWQPLSRIGYRRDGWDEKIELNGTEGRLELYSTLWTGKDSPLVRHYVEREQRFIEYLPGQKDQFNDEIRAFVECVEQGKRPSPDVLDGYKVQKVIDAIYRSGERKEPVRIVP